MDSFETFLSDPSSPVPHRRRPLRGDNSKESSFAPSPYATGRLSQAQILPPPPMPVPPASLFSRLLEDLGFSDGPALCTILDSWNEDLFSSLPLNTDLYQKCQFLSTLPSDVIAWGDAYVPDRAPIDIRARGQVSAPALPSHPHDLPSYRENLSRFFEAELRAREASYQRVLANFCSALYRYLRASTRQLHRQAAVKGRNRDLQDMLRATIAERYYRETARIARVLFLHLYLFLIRETLWATYAEQMMRQDLFETLCCDLAHETQLCSLFQPLLFMHGNITVQGTQVSPSRLQQINHIRERLNLPLIRSAAVEAPKAPLTSPPSFDASKPRASGFFMMLIRAKLDAYSSLTGSDSTTVLQEHAYSRQRGKNNYGSSIEGMLSLPDDDPFCPESALPAPKLSFLAHPPHRRLDTPPITDLSLGDELPLDEEEPMSLADALDDFDLEMFGDDDAAPIEGAAYEALDPADFEFEQMFADALGIDGL
ncbi:transactivating tegument protein VP16 [Pteropodid alphaherpesvirus 1]|uniref:Alpha trans-inducing protein n=1 Tax=Pteropodid alphaherpesvirus 1 TaxID=1343901 RepID=A0A060Q1W6_9ALPH|nr:transactivating tegument protein VP16 [Pteropodid alphaherpesvirus 1]BAP00727.1 transactivating tegument protein VP16 [Pteropodid alphaherpesvirus 1]